MSEDLGTEKMQKNLKIAGTAGVVVISSVAVAVVGASVAVAGVIAVIGLAMVNYVIPVSARAIAVYRQKSLTAIAEHFSEETIRDDETSEGERIKILEKQYTVSRSELEGAQEELEKQMKSSTEAEKQMLQDQINSMQMVIDSAEDTLRIRKTDFAELQRVNKLYITLHRAASAMQKAQGAERNPEELQRIETARNAIKTKMREALAGKTIDAMNAANKIKSNPTDVTGSVFGRKEHDHV